MIPLPSDSAIREAIIEKYYSVEEWENNYILQSSEIKAISDYTSLSFNEIMDLPLSHFLALKKDAWIHNHKQSKEGKELLKTLYRLQQTHADYEKFHQMTSKKRGGN